MSERKSKKQLRKEKLDQERRKKKLLTWVPISVLGLALVGLILFRVFEPDIEGIINFGAQSRNHASDASYETESVPPSGGSHNPAFQNCGIYETPVDSSLAVHSLEHGAVWITYRPDLPTEDVAVLQGMVRGKGSLLLSPFPDQEEDVMMTAWSTQLAVDEVNDGRIDDFISRYRNQGPESAPCNGSVGNPLP